MIRKIVVASVLGFLVSAFGSGSPGTTLAGNWDPRNRFLYKGFEREWDQPARNRYGRFPPKLSLSFKSVASRRRQLRVRRNTQQNFASSGPFSVQANVHQATVLWWLQRHAAFSGSIPSSLAGAGALIFDPTGNAEDLFSGAQSQSRAAFVYGRRATTNSVSTSRFAPNTAASCTNGPL